MKPNTIKYLVPFNQSDSKNFAGGGIIIYELTLRGAGEGGRGDMMFTRGLKVWVDYVCTYLAGSG